MNKRVAIVHPWLPQYRDAFFENLTKKGHSEGIEIDVYGGETPPEWQKRQDRSSANQYTELRTRFYRIGNRVLVSKNLDEIRRNGPYDLIILEQAVRNLETYRLLANPDGAQIAFWGHGRTYTKPVGSVQERLKRLITNSADWFFAYTDGGAESVAKFGFPEDRITVVQNSTDTRTLESEISAISDEDSAEFGEPFDLSGRTGLFIGGIDASKRMQFLIEAADEIHLADDEFRLLIAGAGDDQDFVQSECNKRGWMHYLGPAHGRLKAVAMRASQVLLNPGRVGLVAVDSFAAATPIITTSWEWHAPEFEYLVSGRNSVVTADSPHAYAASVVETLGSPARLGNLVRGCLADSARYSIQAMSDNFFLGIQCALKQKARRRR